MIRTNGTAKYIVAEIPGEDKYVLMAQRLEYHRHIKQELSRTLNKRVYVRGGGILTIDRDAKTIRTFGKSGDYGKAPLNIVRDILEQEFADYALDLKATNEVWG